MEVLLVTLWAFLTAVDDSSTQMIRRPLMLSFVVGLIMHNVQAGLMIGATLEVMWMGIGNVGAYQAPDVVAGSIISTALAISSTTDVGEAVATATAIAVPTSVLSQQLIILVSTVMVAINPYAKKLADNADVKGTNPLWIPPAIMLGLVKAVPTFLAMKFGSAYIEQLVENLPTTLLAGLSTAGKIVPAVGLAILMLSMLKDAKMWVFLMLGWVLTSYMKVSVLPVTIIAVSVALLYDMAANKNPSTAAAGTSTSDDEEDL